MCEQYLAPYIMQCVLSWGLDLKHLQISAAPLEDSSGFGNSQEQVP